MKKDFIINFSVLFLVNLLVKPAWIFADLLVQRETGQDYGLYFVLFNLSMLFNIVLDLGTTNYNNKKIAANEGKFTGYFSKLFSLRILLSVAYFLSLLFTGYLLGYQDEAFLFLGLLGVNQILLSAILYFRSNLTGLKFFKWDGLVSVTDRVIMCVIIFLLIFKRGENINIFQFIQIQFWGYLLTAILALLLVFLKGSWVLPTWNWKFNKAILKQSFPYALIVVLMAGYSYSDSIMLKQMLNDGVFQNTIYAQSFRLVMAYNNYAYLIAVILLPVFAKLIQQKEAVQPLLRLAGTLIIYGTLVFIVLCELFSKEIITLLYGQFENGVSLFQRFSGEVLPSNKLDLKYSIEVFSMLILVCLPMVFNFTYGALLTAKGEMKILNIVAGIGLIANLILNAVLIPKYGALGAAYSSVGTQAFCAILQCYFAYKIQQLTFSVVHLSKFILIPLLIVLAHCFLLENLPVLQRLITLFFLFSLGLLSFRIITWKNIRALLIK